MIQFTKPINLNGAELMQELLNAGIEINVPPMVDGDSKLWLWIEEKDRDLTKSVVSTHNGTIISDEAKTI